MVDDHHLLEVLEDQVVHQEDLLEQVGILGTAMGCSLDIDAVVAGQDAADPFDRVVVADIVLNSRVLDYWVDIPDNAVAVVEDNYCLAEVRIDHGEAEDILG